MLGIWGIINQLHRDPAWGCRNATRRFAYVQVLHIALYPTPGSFVSLRLESHVSIVCANMCHVVRLSGV